jgi:hypothetical protein
MTATITATIVPAPPRAAPSAARAEGGPARRVPWLGLVALAFAVVQLVLAVPHLGLAWDETVYVSQLDPRHPAEFFSAPRSRGISLLVAPVVALSGSTTVLRVALALMSSAALYGAFRVWRPLLGAGRVALAALLFGGLWVTVLYGPQAMPNLWVALAGVAAVGFFLRAGGPGASRWTLVGLGGAVAAATFFRAPDGGWLALPMLAVCAVARRRRRPWVAVALVAGLAAGAAQWVVEAYLRWGGVGPRLRVSSATEGSMGAHWAGGDAWRSLNGPLLCRPCQVPLTHPALTLWWLALPVLAVAACAVAVRTRRVAVTVVPVVCAASLSVPYLLLIDYSAPRFLLPVYALLALPIAALLLDAVAAVRPVPARAAAGTVLAVLVGLHLYGQYTVERAAGRDARVVVDRYRTAADELRLLGIRPPCLLSGPHALPVGYYTGCASAEVSGNNRSVTVAGLLRRAAGEPSAALARTRGHVPPPYGRHWTRYRLAGTGWSAWLPPHQAVPAGTARPASRHAAGKARGGRYRRSTRG